MQVNQEGATSLLGGRSNVLRIYMFMAMVLVVALKNMVIDPEHANDPFWIRLSVAGFFGLALIASLTLPYAKRNVSFLHMSGMVIISGWLMYLNWANRFGPDFKAGFNILSITSVLLFDNRRDMALFSIFSALFLILGLALTPSPDESIWSYFVINIFVLIVGNVAVVARTATHSQLEIKLSRLLTIQEAAIESNSDAILLVDQDGNYIRCNTAFHKCGAFRRMWSQRISNRKPRIAAALGQGFEGIAQDAGAEWKANEDRRAAEYNSWMAGSWSCIGGR
ncbi:MAG: hypothetical protein U0176_02940 [Bacteroidia bacterium]